jgi:Fur family ferric uptake transcriptional regulator
MPRAAKGRAMTDIIARSMAKGLRMTDQRRVIARVLGEAFDHPDVEELHARAAKVDARISLATVYRTVKLFEESGLLDRHEFGDGRARYEEAGAEHHDHLIDLKTGKVIEFTNEEIEKLLGGLGDEEQTPKKPFGNQAISEDEAVEMDRK